MITTYKYMKSTLFILGTIVCLSACDKEENTPAIDIGLLQRKQWQISYIHELTFSDSIITSTTPRMTTIIAVPVCEQGDGIEFQANQVFVRYNQENQCANQEPIQKGSWMVNQEKKILSFEQTDYEVVALSDTMLTIQKEIAVTPIPGVYIKKMHEYFYKSK